MGNTQSSLKYSFYVTKVSNPDLPLVPFIHLIVGYNNSPIGDISPMSFKEILLSQDLKLEVLDINLNERFFITIPKYSSSEEKLGINVVKVAEIPQILKIQVLAVKQSSDIDLQVGDQILGVESVYIEDEDSLISEIKDNLNTSLVVLRGSETFTVTTNGPEIGCELGLGLIYSPKKEEFFNRGYTGKIIKETFNMRNEENNISKSVDSKQEKNPLDSFQANKSDNTGINTVVDNNNQEDMNNTVKFNQENIDQLEFENNNMNTDNSNRNTNSNNLSKGNDICTNDTIYSQNMVNSVRIHDNLASENSINNLNSINNDNLNSENSINNLNSINNYNNISNISINNDNNISNSNSTDINEGNIDDKMTSNNISNNKTNTDINKTNTDLNTDVNKTNNNEDVDNSQNMEINDDIHVNYNIHDINKNTDLNDNSHVINSTPNIDVYQSTADISNTSLNDNSHGMNHSTNTQPNINVNSNEKMINENSSFPINNTTSDIESISDSLNSFTSHSVINSFDRDSTVSVREQHSTQSEPVLSSENDKVNTIDSTQSNSEKVKLKIPNGPLNLEKRTGSYVYRSPKQSNKNVNIPGLSQTICKNSIDRNSYESELRDNSMEDLNRKMEKCSIEPDSSFLSNSNNDAGSHKQDKNMHKNECIEHFKSNDYTKTFENHSISNDIHVCDTFDKTPKEHLDNEVSNVQRIHDEALVPTEEEFFKGHRTDPGEKTFVQVNGSSLVAGNDFDSEGKIKDEVFDKKKQEIENLSRLFEESDDSLPFDSPTKGESI